MMHRIKILKLALWFLIVPITVASPCLAGLKLAAGGNALATPEAIATLIRAKLVDEFKGDLNGAAVRLNLGDRVANLKLPSRDSDLGRIVQALGLDKTFRLHIQDLMATLNLPVKNLTFKVHPIETNHFKIEAEWSTPRITLSSNHSFLDVPPGLFAKGFTIHLDTFQASVQKQPEQKQARAILLKATLDMWVTSEGVKAQVTSVDSNLNTFDERDFTLNVGTLRVEGLPIKLELQSGATRLIADNDTIHRALAANKASLVTAIQRVLNKSLDSFAKTFSTRLEALPPMNFKIKINPDHGPAQDLLAGIEMQLQPTFLQAISSSALLSVQIGTHTTIGGQAIPPALKPTTLNQLDLRQITAGTDAALMIHEAWLQSLIDSTVMQSRIRTWYLKTAKSNGVDIAPEGVRIHLNPDTKSVVIVANLKIDLKKTIQPSDSARSKFYTRLGDWLEKYFGSGDFIYTPLELHLKFQESRFTADHKQELVFTALDPFLGDRPMNSYDYPSNIDKMTAKVRKKFLADLKTQVQKAIPEQIILPMGRLSPLPNILLQIADATISPNRALVIMAKVEELTK